jgi:uncharacterized protein (TIGR03663 family)
MRRGFQWWFLLAVLVGAALRCAELGSRPMHTDESVNAMNFGQLWRDGYYRYDPTEHHGPALTYASLAWQKLTLAPNFLLWSDARVRSLIIAFGIGLILLLPLLSDGLGKNGALAAAFLTAVSPMMVYYSRDYIHEMLLVFFTLLAFAAGWRYLRERKLRWILLAGAGVGLMQATKETFVFNLAAAGSAAVLNRFFAPAPVKTKKSPVRDEVWKWIAALVAWVIVVLTLFSSFFSNPHGPLDALRTYRYWAQNAAGALPHVHEWSFYAQRLLFFHQKEGPIWSEAFILVLAIGGGLVAFGKRRIADGNKAFVRFLVFYTLILATIYTALPYKTPWCALGFWDGAILLAGIGAAELIARLREPGLKIMAGLILLTGTCQLAFQAWLAAVPYAADPHNPWCYAQTSPGLLDLVKKVNALADISPDRGDMRINVIAPEDDYWPLPWYLRRFNSSEWREEIPANPKMPVDPYAPVVIVSPQLDAGLDAKKAGVGPTFFELRPGTLLELYVQTNLWSAYLQRQNK